MKDRQHRNTRQTDARSDSDRHSTAADAVETGHQQPHAHNTSHTRRDDENEAKQERQFQKRITVLSVVFSGLLLAATSTYAYFAWGQWNAMVAGVGETTQARELEYRAYIGAKGAALQTRPDNPAWGDLRLFSVNTGRTQVHETRLKRVVGVLDAPPRDDTELPKDSLAENASKVPYIPNVDYSTFIVSIPTSEADVLVERAEQPVQPQSTNKAQPTPQPTPIQPPAPSLKPPEAPANFGHGIYFYGAIEYRDIFERWHATRFCFFNRPGTKDWLFCPTFNDAN